MKYSLLIFIALLFAWSCSMEKVPNKFDFKFTDDTLKIQLDMNKHNSTVSGSFYDEGTRQWYLYYGNEFVGIHIYDKDGTEIVRVPFKGMNLQEDIRGVQPISLDSILLFPAHLNKIYHLNDEAIVMDTINLPQTKINDYDIVYSPSIGNPFYHNGKAYVWYRQEIFPDGKSPEEYFLHSNNETRKLPAVQEIDDLFSNQIKLGKPLPIKYGRFVPENRMLLEMSLYFLNEDMLVLGNYHSDSIFIFNLPDFQLLNSLRIESEHIPEIGAPAPEINSNYISLGNDEWNDIWFNSANVADVIYNPTEEIYLITIADRREDPQDTFDCYRNFIAYDKEFRKLNEVRFPCETYGRIIYFDNHFWIPHFDENRFKKLGKENLELIRIEYEEA